MYAYIRIHTNKIEINYQVGWLVWIHLADIGCRNMHTHHFTSSIPCITTILLLEQNEGEKKTCQAYLLPIILALLTHANSALQLLKTHTHTHVHTHTYARTHIPRTPAAKTEEILFNRDLTCADRNS